MSIVASTSQSTDQPLVDHVQSLVRCATRQSRMRDCDVRAALHAKVLADHHDQPDTLVIDEMALWYGTARVDVAVVNGRIHGYEIKSDSDTLERLPAQASVYSRVFDRVTLVVGKGHAGAAVAIVPEWWGIKLATQGPRRAIHFEQVRTSERNPKVDLVAVAALLWRDELEAILLAAGGLRGYRGKTRDALSRRAVEVLMPTDLRAAVRSRLKARDSWRAVAQRM